VLLIEDSRSCVGKRPYDNMLWFCSWEFTTLKGYLLPDQAWTSGPQMVSSSGIPALMAGAKNWRILVFSVAMSHIRAI
jgi:hypothetical protein